MFRSLKRLIDDRRGNFAMITAIAFPMIFAGVALSVDVSNALRLQSELQNANDTAVLYAARHFQVEKQVPTKQEVQRFLDANFGGNATVMSVTKNENSSEFTVRTEAYTQPMLMNYFGVRNQRREVLSKATMGVGGILEFALALDTTWSMNFENRLPGLKQAGAAFVNMLMDVRDRGATVKGAIVPFARYVNVGVSRRNEPWMDVPRDQDTRTYADVCETRTRRVGCNQWRRDCTPAQTINHPARPRTCWNEDGQQVCSGPTPAWTENRPARCNDVCVQPVNQQYQHCQRRQTGGFVTKWNGCVGSRDYPFNVRDEFNGRKFPGLMDITCAPELLPLTDNRATLLAKIDSLWPDNNTYIPEGIMWGTRMLTATQPFTEASGAGSNNAQSQTHVNRKALIVMTDGMNTIRASGRWHNDTNDSAEPDRITLEACAEAKNNGLEVYTVTFGNQVPNAVRDMLARCASKPDYNFHAASNDALVNAFRDIADQLLSIRLSQ
ncbi:MAG: pilus assembly protein TadG-related protein [Rhizobiaceae bacterium]|jgi:Flp pilus assembly protein TadG|nr:pilus assembly protein TadG-related protein [Rhizobiaceae bacterium]